MSSSVALAHEVLVGVETKVTAIAANISREVFAYADNHSPPRIHVHESSLGCRPVARLDDAAVLEVVVLAFSRRGDLLASISGEPDVSLTIWKWESGETLIKDKCSFVPAQLSFNPVDARLVCASGHGRLAVWKLSQTDRYYAISSTEPHLPRECRWTPTALPRMGSAERVVGGV